ncbi:MAG: two-CW domain-containing protein [Thermodesulfobacteriota bacterium]
MAKENCWEVMQCGRQPGGWRNMDLGVCPAATETRMDGIHGGTNGGRACWALEGTLCDEEVQGSFLDKYHRCLTCPFYHQVLAEESAVLDCQAILARLTGG